MAQVQKWQEETAVRINELSESGNDKDAADVARAAAKRAQNDGDSGYARFFEGEALCLEGDMKQGGELILQAAGELPQSSAAQASMGVLLSMQGRIREALLCLDSALAIDPDHELALSQKAVCLSKLYREEEALFCFDRILAVKPRNSHALRNRGVALSRLGREKEALECLNQALAIDPNDAHAKREKKILQDEVDFKGTPMGWIVLWVRKKVVPALKRAWYRIVSP